VWTPSRLQDNDRSIAAQFPVAAVDFIEQAELANGRVYNTYEWGGYLIWRHIPVFIDGRAELYGNDFFLYYLQTIRLSEQWRQPLDEWAIDYVLLKQNSPLATLLITSGEWREAYADQVARVFIRRGSERTE
jgi:hypothetical protein